MTAAAEVAALAMATGIGPADLLAAPAEVYAELVRLVQEREREARRRDLAARLRAAVQ